METHVLPLPIAGLPSTAAPAPSSGEPAANSRAALAAAIADRIDADKIAAAAKRIADRAASAEADAGLTVEQLRRELDAAGREATQAHAEACTEAFRRGEALPAAPSLPPTDSAALALAMASQRALHVSAGELAREYGAAQAAANAAARACRDLADEIVAADARALAAEWIAAVRLSWELQDRITALAAIGDGAFISTEQQTAILTQIDRRRSAIAANAQLIEPAKFDAYLDGLVAEQEKLWLGYRTRLMTDAAAVFEQEERRS